MFDAFPLPTTIDARRYCTKTEIKDKDKATSPPTLQKNIKFIQLFEKIMLSIKLNALKVDSSKTKLIEFQF